MWQRVSGSLARRQSRRLKGHQSLCNTRRDLQAALAREESGSSGDETARRMGSMRRAPCAGCEWKWQAIGRGSDSGPLLYLSSELTSHCTPRRLDLQSQLTSHCTPTKLTTRWSTPRSGATKKEFQKGVPSLR